MTYDPSECYELSPFGFGPFPDPNDPGAVVVCPPHPPGAGYGGLGFGPEEGGAPYGLGAYGGSQFFPALTDPISGGYGGYPYGHGPYGSVDTVPPYITGAISISGFEIEVYFSEEMDPQNPALLDPSSYTLSVLSGAPATSVSVRVASVGGTDASAGDFTAGVTSVIVTHTGTTLGGSYKVTVNGPTDLRGNPILTSVDIPEGDPFGPNTLQPNEATFLARGEPPTYTVVPISGSEIVIDFDQDMLRQGEQPVGQTGVLDPSAYGFDSLLPYPIGITVLDVSHPYLGDESQVLLDVKGMTSLEYQSTISPATAISYDATVLPDDDPDFIGVETGTGTSTIVSGSKLSMSRPGGSTYGWVFRDTSGRVDPGLSTIRVDFTFNAQGTIYTPPLSSFPSPKVGILTVEDGPVGVGVQVRLTLQKAVDGSDQIVIQSDDWMTTVSATWSVGTNTLSVVRNKKAGYVTFVLNDHPLTTTLESNIDEPASLVGGAGLAWTFTNEGFDLAGFQILGVGYTSTSTLYPHTWNFLHNQTTTFTGSSASAKDTLLTKRGPLVKSWGDATPASKLDVTVRVNGTEVGIEEVNPYFGEIELQVPIPLMPSGEIDVTVDYEWFPTPIFGMLLDTPGAVLDKWDRTTGHHDPANHDGIPTTFPSDARGRYQNSRFPMAVVMDEIFRPQPLQISHRYIGFEKEYSALLDSPTTLLLDQSPHRFAVEGFQRDTVGTTVAYEGVFTPPTANPPWTLLGTDAGFLNVGQGTYTLVDNLSGPYDTNNSTVAVYSKEEELDFPSSVFVVTRFYIDETVPDGVFTGVGFGLHDRDHLYLVGALLVNDVQHVGLLLDAEKPDEVESWLIGPQATATAQSQTVLRVPSTSVPTTLEVGDRIQILTGSQTGVYTITDLECETGAEFVLLTIDPGLSATYDAFGNQFPLIYFEMQWQDALATYRLEVDPEESSVQLSMSGVSTGMVLSLDSSTSLPAPGSSALLFSPECESEIFWGSLGRRATNKSVWSFFRYGIVPDQASLYTTGIKVESDLDVLPEEEDPEWFPLQTFGTSTISTGRLLLKSDSGSSPQNFINGYARVEPFLTPEAGVELLTTFKVESGTLGSGDAQVYLDDGERRILVSTLSYIEVSGALNYRRLIDLPYVSLAGILSPEDQGWEPSAPFTLTAEVQNNALVVTQGDSSSGGYFGTLDLTGISFTDTGSRIIEARYAVSSYTVGTSDDLGVLFGADVGTSSTGYRFVGLLLRTTPTPGLKLVTASSQVVQEYNFDWTDGLQHTYRVLADNTAGTVSVLVDNVLLTPTVNLALFSGGAGNTATFFGALTTDSTGVVDPDRASTVEWYALSTSVFPPSAAKRTLGIWKGGDKSLINSWELPRVDSTSARNSVEIGPQIVEMDWRDFVEVRLLHDPEWGVTLFRPDLPLPPYYQGEDHATRLTEPSAGWINVDYSDLPALVSGCGGVRFGALDSRSVTQQWWDRIRYRIFKHPLEDVIAPQNMVLDQFNVITSGELTVDKEAEVLTVTTTSNTSLNLIDVHVYGSYVYKVIDQTVLFTPDQYTFDPQTQTLTLLPADDGTPRTFSRDQVSVTVVLKPGRPVTVDYLTSQPFDESVTLLNEETPPVPKSQVEDPDRILRRGSDIVDPGQGSLGDVVTDSVGAKDFRYVDFTSDALYEQLSFFETDDGGEYDLISRPCEGTLPQGFSGYCPRVGGEGLYAPEGTSLGDSAGASIGTSCGPFSIGAEAGTPLGGTGASKDLVHTGLFIGAPVGAHVMELSGHAYWEEGLGPDSPEIEGYAGQPGRYLIASGGDFRQQVVDSNGDPTGVWIPCGGVLGDTLLWPAGSNLSHRHVGKEIDWHLHHRFEEDPIQVAGDDIPPSLPPEELVNPDGPPSTTGHGSVLAVMENPVGAPPVVFIIEAAN